MKQLIFSLAFVFSLSLSAQTIVGKWKTIDDNTGKPRSIVEIYEREGKFFGKVLKTFPEPGDDPDPICDECEDHRKDQKIIGMEIITDMKSSKKGEYDKGEILDPENGNIYDCKLWIDEEGNLKVRGYLFFFYRTQTWLPYAGE